MKSHQYFGNWPVLNKVGLDCMLLSPVCQIAPFLDPNDDCYQPSKKRMANGSKFVSSISVEENGIVRHMDYGMQGKTAGEPGLAGNAQPPAGKRRRMCAKNKPGFDLKKTGPFCDALMRDHRRAFVIGHAASDTVIPYGPPAGTAGGHSRR
jgi:hypothetical protein